MEPSSNQLPDLSLSIKFNPTTSSLTTELSLAPPSAATTFSGGHGSFTDDQEPLRNCNVSLSDVSDGLKLQPAVHNRNHSHSPTSPYFSSCLLDTTSALTNMPNRSFPYPNLLGVTSFSEISSHNHSQSNNYRYGLGSLDSLSHETQIHRLMRSRSLPKLPLRRCTRAARMRWTTSLHARFVHAVELRGGLERMINLHHSQLPHQTSAIMNNITEKMP
ncbi:hypothetical protein Vadar_015330 [Vaccinium darrowii]|uniref:Uncharacterized protein n=1 Tax=Vaccinium darrowii TaxID=229202 RepID=A0ACB7Y6T0_9ERIC|nr:hypothetical protein Vadar_015330 [Vaccinium darrowii]